MTSAELKKILKELKEEGKFSGKMPTKKDDILEAIKSC
jgi:hypothetical protein